MFWLTPENPPADLKEMATVRYRGDADSSTNGGFVMTCISIDDHTAHEAAEFAKIDAVSTTDWVINVVQHEIRLRQAICISDRHVCASEAAQIEANAILQAAGVGQPEDREPAHYRHLLLAKLGCRSMADGTVAR